MRKGDTQLTEMTFEDNVYIRDSTPTIRTLLSPGTPTTAAVFTSYDEIGDARFIIASGTDAGSAATIQLFDQAGETRFFMDSDGNLVGRDDGGNARIDWDTGTAAGDATLTLLDNLVSKIEISSSDSYRISFTDGGTDVDINMYRVAVTGTPLVFWDESEDAFSQNKGLRITAGKVGIGTNTIPHGAIGAAMLALEGADTSTSGPHIQATTATDNYPLLQYFHWSHDNIALDFDSYYDGAWRSSDVGSNAQIYKTGDLLKINWDTGIAQGSILTWNDGLVLDLTTGRVGIAAQATSTLFEVVTTATAEGTISGNAFLGVYTGGGTFAAFCHSTFRTTANSYALLHQSDGTTYLNAASTKPIYFLIDNSAVGIFDSSGNLGVGIVAGLSGKMHIDQASTTAAIPVATFDQADLSEEFFEFITTVGAGNPIDTAAIGAYYGKARVSVAGVGFKYIALYDS